MSGRSALVACATSLQLLVAAWSAQAYHLLTHASVSQQAFDLSARLRDYAEDVAINTDDIFDPDGGAAASTEFAGFAHRGTLRDWFATGAIREDDYLPHPVFESLFGCEPPLNPQSPDEQLDRPKHHFFDVQREGAGFTLVGGLPALDWALGLQGRGPTPQQNHFSLPDARVYQLRSLTGSRRVERDRNLARLFRTLGHIAHVLQDMAQPQHTRHDPHLGCTSAVLEFVAGGKSWYETYTETRARNQRYRSRNDASRPLVLSGYGPVGFHAYRDYWANASGSGLADFSSRNFFSAGTNLGSFSVAGACGGLPQPVCDSHAYRTEDVPFTIPTLIGDALTGRVRFFLRDVADPVTGQVVQNVRVSSRSLWDQHLETSRQPPKFSLTTYNYDVMADLLLPRAVGYSAGVLDHFFRGRLDVDLVHDGTDPSVARLTGTNASPEALVDGTLTLYAEDTMTGTRSAVTALDSTAITGVAPGGAVVSARFQIPDGAERFVAVYEGTLGTEVSPSGSR